MYNMANKNYYRCNIKNYYKKYGTNLVFKQTIIFSLVLLPVT